MQPYFCVTCEIALADARVHRTDQECRVVAVDHALGHARAGGRRGLGVHVDRLDRPAQHAALVVELLDRHHRAQALLAAAGRVLAAGVHRQADHQRLGRCALRPHVRVAQGPKKLPPPASAVAIALTKRRRSGCTSGTAVESVFMSRLLVWPASLGRHCGPTFSAERSARG
jgi:hypothetical protein